MKEQDGERGLYSTVTKHPLITGGLILAGAGLAYATVKTIKSTTNQTAREVHIETSITINKTPEELYSFWRDFKNLPLFMRHLESVNDSENGRSHWVVRGVGGAKVEWDAEIFNEIPNKLIAWRSLEEADVVNAGSVRFERAPEGRGTYVQVTMNYNPPAGKVGAKLASLLGGEPAQLIKDDLRRLKQVLETGEIATVEGQSSGRVSEEDRRNENEFLSNEPSELEPFKERAQGQTI